MCEAAKALNIHVSTISNYFRKNQKKPYKKRYVFTKIGGGSGTTLRAPPPH
jgi:hypothetical protein